MILRLKGPADPKKQKLATLNFYSVRLQPADTPTFNDLDELRDSLLEAKYEVSTFQYSALLSVTPKISPEDLALIETTLKDKGYEVEFLFDG